MNQTPSAATQHPHRRYVYVWEFVVASGKEAAFVAAYGPAGAWARLFRKAPGYVETLLLQDQSVPGRFVTIDRWANQGAHDAFQAQFEAEYLALDRACEALTQHEHSLGSYWERDFGE